MQKTKTPVAPKRSKILTNHGVRREDPWFWLRDKDDPAAMEYLKAENAYTDAIMQDTRDLQEALYAELRARIKEDDDTVPEKEGSYFYYDRYETGRQYPISCRKHQSLDSPEEIILNVNELAQGRPYLRLGVCENSKNHRYLAYSLDTDGSEEYTIQIKNLAIGELLRERITGTYDSLEWGNDSATFFYTVLDKYKRPRKAYRHRLGDDPVNDKLIFDEQDPRFFVSLCKSKSDRFIYLSCDGNNMSEWYYMDADNPDDPFKLIEPRQEEHEYDVTDHGERFFIRTNIGKAKDFKVVTTPIDTPRSDHWQDFIEHRSGRLITDITTFRDHLVVSEMIQGLPQIRITDLVSNSSRHIKFDEEAYDVYVIGGREFDTTILRFGYSSLTTPEQIYDYDMATGERVLRKEQEVLGDFDRNNYQSKRVYAKSHDGVDVPVSLLLRTDTALDGTAPLVLYGYGSYGHSMSASFSSLRLSYVDRGFIYAIAHIRGGMEMGYEWYEAGKLLKKKNTFDDYIACAEHLIKTKLTAKGQILGIGGSAGGLLMGAVANMCPDLFKAIIAHVPFVDAMNTMLDETLPLTTMEYNEWGNPTNKEYFDYILSYSPYDNVKAQDYPHMLIIGGMNDPRVTYWEPAKWTAKLRDAKTDDNLLLLKVHMEFGHAGPSGRFDYLKEVALDVAFTLKVFSAAMYTPLDDKESQ
ncbi:MAG: S9 family peptidase [Acidiferrobacterales bacterium]